MATGERSTAEGVPSPPVVHAAPERPGPGRHAALPLPLALLTLGLTYWCVDIVAPALPQIRDALALSGTGAGLVFALFFAGRLVTTLPASLLIDRIGARRIAAIGGGGLLIGSTLAALSGGAGTLLAARVLQGVGVAFLSTAGLLSVLRALPGGGAAMTAFNVAVGLGGSAGLLSSGWLTETVGWRAIFWLSAVLGGALLVGTRLGRAASPLPPDESTAGGDAPAGSIPSPSRAALGGALLANLLVYGNYSVWVVSLSLYATERFGADAGAIGALLLTINVVHLSAAVPAGRVIRRAGARRSLAAGYALTAVGLACVLAAPSVGWLALPMAFYAVGQVAANSAAGDLVLRLGGGGGRAVGVLRLSSDVGLVAGPAAVGVLVDVAGVAAPFPVLAGLTALGALAAALGSRSGRA